MTIENNFRVFLKKNTKQTGTIKEIHQTAKIKKYKILWDEQDGGDNSERLFYSTEIMELYKLKTLSTTEKLVLLRQRDQIVEENVKVKWQQKRQIPNISTTVNGSMVVDDDQLDDSTTHNTLTMIKTDTNCTTGETSELFLISASVELLPTSTTTIITSKINNKNYSTAELVSLTKTLVIEPSYIRHRFCKYTDFHTPRFSCSLSINTIDDENDDKDDNSDDDNKDGDEIYNPNYPHITKAMMREYIGIFTFEELFRNDLLHRLNESQNPIKIS
jgi:hypothetical protein